MLTNKERYQNDIKNHSKDYKVTISEFLTWLHEDRNREKTFANDLADVFNGNIDIYYIAVDYSIPIIMVKWFLGC